MYEHRRLQYFLSFLEKWNENIIQKIMLGEIDKFLHRFIRCEMKINNYWRLWIHKAYILISCKFPLCSRVFMLLYWYNLPMSNNYEHGKWSPIVSDQNRFRKLDHASNSCKCMFRSLARVLNEASEIGGTICAFLS